MPLTFAETPLYYRDSQGQYHRILSGADMTGYRTAAAQDAIDTAQNGNLATIESSPATAAHAVGDYVVYNGQLYKVTAAIAAGETLTVGTNIEQTNLSNELPIYSANRGYGSSGSVTYASDLEWAMARTALITYGRTHVLFIGFTPTAHPNEWYTFATLNDISIAPTVEGYTDTFEVRAPAIGENNTVRTAVLTETGELRIYKPEHTGYYITFVWAK